LDKSRPAGRLTCTRCFELYCTVFLAVLRDVLLVTSVPAICAITSCRNARNEKNLIMFKALAGWRTAVRHRMPRLREERATAQAASTPIASQVGSYGNITISVSNGAERAFQPRQQGDSVSGAQRASMLL
jgi:hypothetical protein